jgi:hypothetical protein
MTESALEKGGPAGSRFVRNLPMHICGEKVVKVGQINQCHYVIQKNKHHHGRMR